MLINDMRYLEEVVEASSIVGGNHNSKAYYKYCDYYDEYTDEDTGEYYESYWECYDKIRKPYYHDSRSSSS